MVYADYPAAKGGLKIGDEIIKMDNVELARLTMEQSINWCAAANRQTGFINVLRGQEKPIELSFKRENKINNVPYFGMVKR